MVGVALELLEHKLKDLDPVRHPQLLTDVVSGTLGALAQMPSVFSSGSVRHMKEHHHGPNKVVLGVAIALSSIVFLVVFLILCSKCCR